VSAKNNVGNSNNFHYAVHNGELHWFDNYEAYQTGEWATYIAQNGTRYGIEIELISKTSQEAATKFIEKQARMVRRNLKESREAAERAENWANALHRFSLTGSYSPKCG
jgi:hypothetical protein